MPKKERREVIVVGLEKSLIASMRLCVGQISYRYLSLQCSDVGIPNLLFPTNFFDIDGCAMI